MPLLFFTRKSRVIKRAVGLDIGSHSIKMVAVSGAPGALTLTDCVVSAMEVVSENPLPIATVTRAIADTVGRSGLYLSDLRVSVSGKGAIVRHSEMPRMSPHDLKSSIRYEAEMLLPFSLDDCIFDCQILDLDNKSSARMKVVLAAARKAVVQERLDLVNGIGLAPRIMSIDSIALANAFESAMAGGTPRPAPRGELPSAPLGSALRRDQDNAHRLRRDSAPGQAPPGPAQGTAERGSDETVLVVHVGACRTILNVMSAAGLEFTRDIEVGGNNATLAIARGLGIEFQEAERRKQAGDAAAREFIPSMVMVLSRELRSTCSYISSKMNKNVGKIYLSGGGALCRGIRETLATELGIEVSFWNPLRGISPGAETTPGEPGSKEAVLVVAAGLALAD
jgi:type IV pilus assembly protein PilM